MQKYSQDEDMGYARINEFMNFLMVSLSPVFLRGRRKLADVPRQFS